MAQTDRNEVLEDTVPSGREVQTDVLEWWCHVVLQDCNSPELYSRRVIGCYQVMEELGESVGDQGRLFNRTQLATLCCDLLNRPIVPKDDTEYEDEEDEDDDTPLSKLAPEKWAEYRESVELARSNLLRKDANFTGGEDVDEEVDTDLEALPKFSQDYQAVMNLLELCEVVAHFQRALDKLSISKAKKQKILLQKVESAVDDYKKGLHKLQLDKEEELTSFLLADMYKAKPKDLAQRLQEHLLEVMTNDEYECGYSQITQKTRRLLCRWQSQVLDVPKLCRLGYGGFVKRKSSIAEDNVSVSSLGVNEDEFQQHKQVEQDDDDSEEYATAADDDTADEAEANAAFAFSTQPPVPESPDKDAEDGDKKPRAKRKKSQQEEEEEEEESTKIRSKDLPRQSCHLASDEPRKMPPRASPARKKSPPRKSPTRRKTSVAKEPPKSPGMESVVYSEEEVSAQQKTKDGDEIMTQPDSSPP